MADEERGKRKRGRHRPRSDAHRRPIEPQQEDAGLAEEQDAREVASADEESEAAGTRHRFTFGRGDKKPAGASKEKSRAGERHSGGVSEGSVSPMDFWRSGTPRPHRPVQVTTPKGPRFLRRITGMYLPPWAPVVGIIVVVFGILGFLFFVRSATGSPRIGDHWHATYQFFACGEKQANARQWESGVHTHADGIIHIHPFQTFEEGSGARLEKWFEYGGGKLTGSEINIPGSSKTWKNGDTCPDGKTGELQVYVTRAGSTTEERLKGSDLSRFIPHDGDRVRIVFGPPEEVVQEKDRTIIPEEQATRTVELTVTDTGTDQSTKFEPNSVEVNQGEVVKLVVKNTGKISHGFRVSGADGVYGNADDFVVQGDVIQPGQEGKAVVRLDITGEVAFRDDTLQDKTGSIVVREGTVATPSPSPANQEKVDAEFDMTTTDNAFSQTQLTVAAGAKFRINMKNDGPKFVHSLRIAGPDGEFNTKDDLVSDPAAQKVGVPGKLVGQIDQKGSYPFRCDFHPTEMTGTIVVN